MPSSPNPHRHAKTGRSECVPELWFISDVSKLINFFFCLQKELKKLAKAQGSVVPLSVGTPLPSTPATTSMPAQPPRTSTPTPAPRGIKREFEDSALTQPNAQGPGPAAVNSSGSVSPTSGHAQRPGAAKAGVPGARPRPLKKQRVVSFHFTLSETTQSCLYVLPSDHNASFRFAPPLGGYLCTQGFALLTFIYLSSTGPARPGERHASASANTAAYSTGRVILPHAASVRS
jgi:hypothetical protein